MTSTTSTWTNYARKERYRERATQLQEAAREIERDPERRERMEQKRKSYDVILNLAELREAKGLTQAGLAERLSVSQPNVSKLETAAGSPQAGVIYLSTLGRYIAALGGHLEVRAVFPEHPEEAVVAVGGGWVEEPDAGRRDG